MYNENDEFAASWLQELIDHGVIPKGQVDRRSIVDLAPADVAGPGQRHFFAGIGGWPYALRLAGLPDDADIWTGSCPCQGLSDAGERRGFLDPRHLWPAWFPLIEQCRPPVLFGEQVASTLGLEWLDLVFADLERSTFTVETTVCMMVVRMGVRIQPFLLAALPGVGWRGRGGGPPSASLSVRR